LKAKKVNWPDSSTKRYSRKNHQRHEQISIVVKSVDFLAYFSYYPSLKIIQKRKRFDGVSMNIKPVIILS